MQVGLGPVIVGMGKGQVVLISSSVIHKAADNVVVHLLQGTNTGRVGVYVDSPPIEFPYFFNVSATRQERLITTDRSRRRVYGVVNTSGLRCLSRGKLTRSVSHVQTGSVYFTYFSNSCPRPIPNNKLSNVGRWKRVCKQGRGKTSLHKDKHKRQHQEGEDKASWGVYTNSLCGENTKKSKQL